jgi:uroporphyrinogen decarboxylase
MVEGMGSKTFSKPRAMLYKNPQLSHKLLQMITDATIDYLKMQIKAGADLVQIFDSWAGVLSPEAYREFSLPYLEQIADQIQEVPKTMFAKDAWFALADLNKLNFNTIGLDWCIDAVEARKLVPKKVLQGNLDPAILYGSDELIQEKTKAMLNKFGSYNHIVNLGHGVYPDIDPDKVRVFIKTIKDTTYPLEK